jgi:hypothetical protein
MRRPRPARQLTLDPPRSADEYSLGEAENTGMLDLPLGGGVHSLITHQALI